MDLYREYIYPYLVDILGDPPPIQAKRRQIIPLAHGKVLEIGIGSGANLIHYDPAQVSRLYALEPNPGMIRLAQRHLHRSNVQVEFLDLAAEQIPLADDSIDTVVSTFTLCTIPDVEAAIQGIGRVLKPDGKFLFIELGLSPDPTVQRWQKRLEPVFHRLFQGLYLTRDIPSLIMQGGFQIKQVEKGYLTKFLKVSSYCWWGNAILQGS